MSNVVNLRQARKAIKRDRKKTQAAENAVRFGRTKSERQLEKAQSLKAERDLDGHELDK